MQKSPLSNFIVHTIIGSYSIKLNEYKEVCIVDIGVSSQGIDSWLYLFSGSIL